MALLPEDRKLVQQTVVTPRVSTVPPFDVQTWGDNDTALDAMFNTYLIPPEQAGGTPRETTISPVLSPYDTAQGAPAQYLSAWRNHSINNAQAERVDEANAGIYDAQMKNYNSNLQSILGGGGSTVAKTGGVGPTAYGYKGRTGVAGTKGTGYLGMQKVFWDRLSTAFRDMQAAGLGKPGVTDGWRSYAAQVAVKAKKGNLAATPGRSVHGLGLAADLDLNRKQQKWLEANAGRYGIQRLASESWHWQLNPKLWKGGWG